MINKLTNEREQIIMEQKKNNNNIKISKDDSELELKEAKLIINNLSEKIKALEEENKNMIKQKEDSEYKSEGEEEYTMKKMVNATKNTINMTSQQLVKELKTFFKNLKN